MTRKIRAVYQDPLDLIWMETAARLGMNVVRDPYVFASWDGQGTLKIGEADTLDSDDCLAQMVFHELCHALVEGPQSINQPDWGLVNSFDGKPDEDSVMHERACLRLQAALADQFGLREFFAATTDFRNFYDGLGADPFSVETDHSVPLAVEGWKRAQQMPWSTALEVALQLTRNIVQSASQLANANSLFRLDQSICRTR